MLCYTDVSNNLDFLWHDFYFGSNSLVFENALNWDAVAPLVLADMPFLSFFLNADFVSSFVFLDLPVKLSFVDVYALNSVTANMFAFNLFIAFLTDLAVVLNMHSPFVVSLFFSEYQDLSIIILQYAPELVLAFNEYYFEFWAPLIFTTSVAAFADLYADNLNFSVFELFEFLILNSFFFLLVVLIFYGARVSKWSRTSDHYIGRFVLYLYSMAREIRFQFDAMLWLFGFLFLCVFFAIMTFDDDREEQIEQISTFWFSLFLSIILFLIYRYSYHYFSFLEISVSEGKTVSFIAKQFFRDFVNTFALLLRFFILVFRLNVYDGLDDLYDSYYFFVGDYDEDEYHDELFFSLSALLFFESDNQDDRSFLYEEEHDWSYNIFHLLYLVWGKFFFFLFFLIEELMRVALATYIIYLIIFDVHAVNCSYVEDTYFTSKRGERVQFRRAGVSVFFKNGRFI